MFPLLFNMMKRWSAWKALASIGMCTIIPVFLSIFLEVENLHRYREWLLYVFPPVRLLDYFDGMQVAWLFCNRKRKMESRKITALQIVVIIVSVLLTWFLNADCQAYVFKNHVGVHNCIYASCYLGYIPDCSRSGYSK